MSYQSVDGAVESVISIRVKQTVRLFVVAMVLLISAHRLPAPISEVKETPATRETPTNVKQKKKSKSTEAKADFPLRSTGRFDGTWIATTTSTGGHHEQLVDKITMVVRDGKNAVLVDEHTATLAPGGYWSDLPNALKFSVLFTKSTRHASDLIVDGSHLRVRWSPVELSDWSPKEAPSSLWQEAIKKSPGWVTSVYTLTGDELTLGYDSPGGFSFKRVK